MNNDELSILKELQNKWIVEKKKAEDDFNRALSERYGTWRGQETYGIYRSNLFMVQYINLQMS